MPSFAAPPRLMLVADLSRSRLPLLDLVAEAVAGGIDGIYLRGEFGTGEATPGLVRELRARIGHEVTLLVNGSPESALAAGTGLHLRERDPIPENARAFLPACALLGRSVHSPEAAAASTGVDYLLAGHVFPSASKPGREPLGLERFAAIVAASPCPVLAIGGITAERVEAVMAAGAHGVAVIGAIAEAADPRAATATLRAAIDRALHNQLEDASMSQETMTTIEIVANGRTHILPAPATVADFLASKKLTGSMAIVERNGLIVARAAYDTTPLASGDHLEVVHAVGGG